MCAHGEQRRLLRHYELTLPQLERFLDATRRSGYRIGEVSIHGPGEPLLWKHFDEGVRLIARSGLVDRILITTNGLLLTRIAEKTWTCIDEVHVSLYPAFDRHDELRACKDRYPDKVRIVPTDTFLIGPLGRHDEGSIPCVCACEGPMLVGDRVFLYCGPPVFGAGTLLGRDVMADGDLSVPVGPGYMDARVSGRVGTMDYCKLCWANARPRRYTIPHTATGGGWR